MPGEDRWVRMEKIQVMVGMADWCGNKKVCQIMKLTVDMVNFRCYIS